MCVVIVKLNCLFHFCKKRDKTILLWIPCNLVNLHKDTLEPNMKLLKALLLYSDFVISVCIFFSLQDLCVINIIPILYTSDACSIILGCIRPEAQRPLAVHDVEP